LAPLGELIPFRLNLHHLIVRRATQDNRGRTTPWQNNQRRESQKCSLNPM
jgi:hypothetical protein